MARYKYMRIPMDIIPDEVIKKYNLCKLVVDGWAYMGICKVMPSIEQARKFSNERLKKHLGKYGYTPCARTAALWTCVTFPITFTLVVDDSGVKYTGKHTALHLLNSLKDLYTVSVD